MSRELRDLLVKLAPVEIDEDEIEEKGRGGTGRSGALMGGRGRGGTMGAYVAMGRGLDKARGPLGVFGGKAKLGRIQRARNYLFNRYQGGVGGRGIRTGSGYQLPPARR